MPTRVLRIVAAAIFLLALAFALARFGGTEERVLNAVFLLALVPALAACLAIDLTRIGRWQGAALAVAGLFLGFRVAVVPVIETRGHVLAALAWVALVVSLWLAESSRLRRLLIVAVIVAGAAEAMYGFTQALGGMDRIFDYNRKMGRIATGTLVNRNHFAALLNMSMGLGLGLLVAAHARGKALRSAVSEVWARAWLVILACAVLGLALLLSRSRAGILSLALMALFVGLLLYLSSRLGRSSAPPPYVAVLFLLVTLGLGMLVGLGAVAERFTGEMDRLRPQVYRDSLRLISDHPWTGVGGGMYGWRFQEYQSAPSDRSVLHAHSDYLEIAAEWGVPLALVLVLLVLRRLHRSARTFLSTRDPLVQGVALGCAASIFSILVHGLIDFNLQVPANLMLFTMILAVAAGLEPPGAERPRARRWSVVARVAVCVALVLAGGRAWNLLEAQAIVDQGETIESLSRALELEPSDPEHHARLGVLYREGPETVDLELSLRHLQRAIELNPWDRSHHFELGRTQEELGEWDRAEASYRRATTGNPVVGRYHWRLAQFHLFNGDRDLMYEPLKTALSADRSLFAPAIAFVVNTATPPDQIDRLWPEDRSARIELVRGLRLGGAEQRRRYLRFAVDQWRRIVESDDPPTVEEGHFFIRELLAAGELEEARRQWSALAAANGAPDPEFEQRRNAIWNGGFELPILGRPLGWRFRRVEGVSWSVERWADGGRVMVIELSGEENVRYGGLEQTIVLAPGSYRFEFEAEAEGLTTDEGLYFDIFDPAGRRSLLETEELLGDVARRGYSIPFEAPAGVERVELRLLRQPSRRIDSRIRGRLLLDNLTIAPADG